MEHDFKVDGKQGTKMLKPGETETVEVDGVSSSTEAWCTVPGHKEAGMVMKIEVEGGSSNGQVAAPAAETASTGATIDPNATPPADFKPYDPTLQPAPGGTVHDVTIHAVDKMIEVAPGVKQKMWTFDGKVPGTILRGHVGDLFNVTLVNDGTMGHSIDFHASRVAPNVEMRTIQPGESLLYQFKADYAGAWMYHCGTKPTLHHIANGMYGAIIIDPPDLAPVDHEFVIVQSELYLGAQGKEADLNKALAEKFDAVVFNGYYNQYASKPIRVEPNQRIRVWVIDDGPSENSSFHIVGTIFDTVFKEGAYLLRPDASHGGSQALDLQPAQGGFVEFSLAQPGMYPFVTHKFSNASKGAMGIFQAGDVAPSAMGGH
jgi:nitrite reductase (NO-forming)